MDTPGDEHPSWGSDEKGAPLIMTPQVTGSRGAAIARAAVSLTLLAVMLLAFGVALAGWFIRDTTQRELRTEIEETYPEAQLVAEYRDALVELTDQMSKDRGVAQPPNMDLLYEKMMAKRDQAPQGRYLDWQKDIDILRRHNADIRWVNDRLYERSLKQRFPPSPRRNAPP